MGIERKEENVKNIFKRSSDVTFRDPGKRGFREEALGDVYELNLGIIGMRETSECLSSAMYLLMQNMIILFYLSMQFFKCSS